MASGGIFAIKMEAEVARLFVSPPLEQRGAIVLREHAERSEIDCGRRLDGGNEGRSVVGKIGIAGGGGDGGGIARERSGAEGVGGDVDGDDGHASDAECTDGAGNGGGRRRVRASALRSRGRRVGNLRGQRIADGYALGDGWTGIGDLQCVSKVGALVHRLRRRCFDDADVGLRGQSDGGGGGRRIVSAIRILGSRAGRVIYVCGIADYRACWRRSRQWPSVDLNYQREVDRTA